MALEEIRNNGIFVLGEDCKEIGIEAINMEKILIQKEIFKT